MCERESVCKGNVWMGTFKRDRECIKEREMGVRYISCTTSVDGCVLKRKSMYERDRYGKREKWGWGLLVVPLVSMGAFNRDRMFERDM